MDILEHSTSGHAVQLPMASTIDESFRSEQLAEVRRQLVESNVSYHIP